MNVGDGEFVPGEDEQWQAIAVLWGVGSVGAAAFLVYDLRVPDADLPLVLVPLMYLALVGATAALWLLED